eukprot:4402785-Pleurochrysis_carterae.AAC.7
MLIAVCGNRRQSRCSQKDAGSRSFACEASRGAKDALRDRCRRGGGENGRATAKSACSRRYSMNESPYCGVNSMAKSRKLCAACTSEESKFKRRLDTGDQRDNRPMDLLSSGVGARPDIAAPK